MESFTGTKDSSGLEARMLIILLSRDHDLSASDQSTYAKMSRIVYYDQ